MRVKTLSVADGKRLGISDFPNFFANGSIKGMKKQFYGEDALLIRCGSYIYHVGNLKSNTSESVVTRGEMLYFNRAH